MEKIPLENLSQKERRPEEIIADPEKVRDAMRQFWYREIDSKSLKGELKLQEEQHLDDLLGVGYEMEALRRTTEGREIKDSAPSFEDKNRFVFASQNEIKQQIVAKAAENQGMMLQETLFSPGQEEEKLEHQILKQLIQEEKEGKRYPRLRIPTIKIFSPAFYAVDIAAAKTSEMAKAYKDRIIIASDIVVLQGNQILEKPENKEEALKVLNNLSGKEVRVALGTTVLTPTNFGKTVMFKEGAYLTIKLRNFSEVEAKKYFDQAGESCLNTAGVVDYANPLSRSLISDKPTKLEALEFSRKFGESPKVISISPDILSGLKDYFMGVPNELTQEMLRRVKLLHRR